MRCGICDVNDVIPDASGFIPDCTDCVRAIFEGEPVVHDLGEEDHYAEWDSEDFSDMEGYYDEFEDLDEDS